MALLHVSISLFEMLFLNVIIFFLTSFFSSAIFLFTKVEMILSLNPFSFQNVRKVAVAQNNFSERLHELALMQQKQARFGFATSFGYRGILHLISGLPSFRLRRDPYRYPYVALTLHLQSLIMETFESRHILLIHIFI